MSRNLIRFLARKRSQSKLRKIAAIALDEPGRSLRATLAITILLLAAAGAQGEFGPGDKLTRVAAESGITSTITSLGSSANDTEASKILLQATVQNADESSAPAPTGTVTFFNGTAVIGSMPLGVGDTAALPFDLPAGSYSVTAYYSGDLQHGTSTSPALTIVVSGSDFNLNVNPATVTVASKQNVTVTVSLDSLDGFADAVGLGCASLPAGVSCQFSSATANVEPGQNPTVQLTIGTDNPPIAGLSKSNSRSEIAWAGLSLPLSLLLGLVLWRFRRRHTSALAMMTIALLSGAALCLPGCCDLYFGSTMSGSYVIQVTGVGSSSGITHAQNVELNITQ